MRRLARLAVRSKNAGRRDTDIGSRTCSRTADGTRERGPGGEGSARHARRSTTMSRKLARWDTPSRSGGAGGVLLQEPLWGGQAPAEHRPQRLRCSAPYTPLLRAESRVWVKRSQRRGLELRRAQREPRRPHPRVSRRAPRESSRLVPPPGWRSLAQISSRAVALPARMLGRCET